MSEKKSDEIRPNMSGSVSVSISMRKYLSGYHIYAACLFAGAARDLEASGQSVEEVERQHKANVVSALIATVAFLEAGINELFCDAAENLGELQPIGDEVVRCMGRVWRLGVPRTAAYSVLEKFEIALSLAGKPELDRGRKPTQDVVDIVKLRNALIHYEPEWITGDAEPHGMEKRFRGRFTTNQLFLGIANPFYPDHCLGFGCCKWAIESALDFYKEFWATLGLPNRHSDFWSTLPSL